MHWWCIGSFNNQTSGRIWKNSSQGMLDPSQRVKTTQRADKQSHKARSYYYFHRVLAYQRESLSVCVIVCPVKSCFFSEYRFLERKEARAQSWIALLTCLQGKYLLSDRDLLRCQRENWRLEGTRCYVPTSISGVMITMMMVTWEEWTHYTLTFNQVSLSTRWF